MERLNEEGKFRPINNKDQNSCNVAETPKIPAFNENQDEMDSYLLCFERYATAQRWKRDQLATNLSALLKDKALDVYALMLIEQALNLWRVEGCFTKTVWADWGGVQAKV